MNENWKQNVTLFLTSQTISLIGSLFVQYAILWRITLNTQSGVMMTLAIISGFIPSLFITPFAGVGADRYDRKKLIIISDALIASVTLIMAIIYLFDLEAILIAILSLRYH